MTGLMRAVRRVQFGWARYLTLAILAAAGSWTAVRVAAELVPTRMDGQVAQVSLNGVPVRALVIGEPQGSPPMGDEVRGAQFGVELEEGLVFPLVTPSLSGAEAIQLQGPLRIAPARGAILSPEDVATGSGVRSDAPGTGTGRSQGLIATRILLGLAVALISAAFWALLCADMPDESDVATMQRLGMTRRQALAEWIWLAWMMAVLGLGIASIGGLVAGIGGLLATDVLLLVTALFAHGAGASVAILAVHGLHSR